MMMSDHGWPVTDRTSTDEEGAGGSEATSPRAGSCGRWKRDEFATVSSFRRGAPTTTGPFLCPKPVCKCIHEGSTTMCGSFDVWVCGGLLVVFRRRDDRGRGAGGGDDGLLHV